jgi:hypothetical protein
MRRSVILLGAFTLFMVIGTAEVRSQEEAVPQDKIPKAVMDALLAKFPKAKIGIVPTRPGRTTWFELTNAHAARRYGRPALASASRADQNRGRTSVSLR